MGAIALQLADADPALLIATGAISMGGGLIGALRWKLLLEPLGVSTSFKARWAALNVGFMVSNLLPGRLGDIARPIALGRVTPIPTSGALGTVLLERVLDTVALLILFVAALLSPAFPSGATVSGRPIAYAVSTALLVAAVAIVAVTGALFFPHLARRLARFLMRPLRPEVAARAMRKLDSFVSGLELVRRPADLVKAVLWSLLLWVCMSASVLVAFRAFGIELGFTGALFTQCAIALFVALPAGPGAIGTLQAGVLVSLHGVFAVPAESALSLAVGYHVAGFIPGTSLGLYYAWRLGSRLGTIDSDAEAGRGTAP